MMIKIRPVKIQSLSGPGIKPFNGAPMSNGIINPERIERVTERNDGPACSMEHVRNYRENWENILPPRVVRQLKKSGDIMHGSYSVNMQVTPKYRREAHDIDVWSKEPQQRAVEMENEIDECVGCDIAQVRESRIGVKSPLQGGKFLSLGPPRLGSASPENDMRRRFTVETTPENDTDVDYTYPQDDVDNKDLVTLNGVRHEGLPKALWRAENMAKTMPMRAAKAQQDINRIGGYLRSRGR